ncbi:Uncharacterized conserved protein [Phaffia rhodozyma]|uniref:Uncharacterized conserved protein n=1 Tax=Phaffia rhodozyma TaxID=264483 RepID=A0A0F7ST30_PHARH|nr:Uncharacterized conserved protein [Phaffia rhodozyma]
MSALSQYQELIPFLRDTNPQVRQLALSNLLGQTVKTSPYRQALFFPSSNLSNPSNTSSSASSEVVDAGKDAALPSSSNEKSPLWSLKLLCRDQTMIAHDAFSALVNLSDSALVQKELGDDAFLVFLVSYIVNPTSVLSSLASMLLSNITSSLAITKSLSTLLIPFIPLLPNSTINPPHLQTYYLPSSRSASALPPPNMALPNQEVTVEYVPCLSLLVEAFIQGAAAGEPGKEGEEAKKGTRKGDCHFLATVFSNLSMLPPIRQALLSPAVEYPKHPESTLPATPEALRSESLLSKLLIFTEHKDTIRRGGVLSTLKHIAMSAQTHPLLLTLEDSLIAVPHLSDNPLARSGDTTSIEIRGVDVLPKILGPLMGGEEIDLDDMEKLPSALQFQPEDKQREQDGVLRLTCVEILLLLCTSLRGRNQLRDRGAYVVIKFAHKAETDEKIADQMYRLVNLLQREEGPDTRIEEITPDEETVDSEDEGIVEV